MLHHLLKNKRKFENLIQPVMAAGKGQEEVFITKKCYNLLQINYYKETAAKSSCIPIPAQHKWCSLWGEIALTEHHIHYLLCNKSQNSVLNR